MSSIVATGIGKQVRYKAEATWAVAPGASGAQLLRRVTSSLDLKKGTFESGELVSHMQRNDVRHGVRSVEGALSAELSPGTYKDFMAAAVRRAFAAVTAIAGASITVAGSGPTYTITRAAGSWLTDGIKFGQVGRLTAGSFNAANLNKNLLVLAVTSATVLTVQPLNGAALVAEGPIAAATWTIPGKVTYAPSTGHTNNSFAIEHLFNDVSPVMSELYIGCKANQMDVAMPAGGMATINLSFLGQNSTDAAAQYYTSPTGETTTGVVDGVTGILVVNGTPVAYATSFSLSLKGNMSAEAVVGSNVYADIAQGPIVVDGNFTSLVSTSTLRDYFRNETEISLIIAAATSPLAAADFITFTLPRVKLKDAAKDDGPKSLTQSMPFDSLYYAAGGAGQAQEQTSLYIHDSQA